LPLVTARHHTFPPSRVTLVSRRLRERASGDRCRPDRHFGSAIKDLVALKDRHRPTHGPQLRSRRAHCDRQS